MTHHPTIGSREVGLEDDARAADGSKREMAARQMSKTVEAISPELALVDPELARAHLASLGPRSHQSFARTPVAARTRVRSERDWAGPATLVAVLSLAANGFLAAYLISHNGPASAAPATTVTVQGAAAASAAAPSTPPRPTAAVEQRILSLVAGPERRRLPRTLVDRTTGLPVNNLQAVCRGGGTGSMQCLVRPARHRPGEGLAVRYTPGAGAGSFTWYPYRSG